MARLSTSKKKAEPKSDFGLPKQRKYPMPDAAHARNAKARASQMEHPAGGDVGRYPKLPWVWRGLLSLHSRPPRRIAERPRIRVSSHSRRARTCAACGATWPSRGEPATTIRSMRTATRARACISAYSANFHWGETGGTPRSMFGYFWVRMSNSRWRQKERRSGGTCNAPSMTYVENEGLSMAPQVGTTCRTLDGSS